MLSLGSNFFPRLSRPDNALSHGHAAFSLSVHPLTGTWVAPTFWPLVRPDLARPMWSGHISVASDTWQKGCPDPDFPHLHGGKRSCLAGGLSSSSARTVTKACGLCWDEGPTHGWRAVWAARPRPSKPCPGPAQVVVRARHLCP